MARSFYGDDWVLIIDGESDSRRVEAMLSLTVMSIQEKPTRMIRREVFAHKQAESTHCFSIVCDMLKDFYVRDEQFDELQELLYTVYVSLLRY